MDTVRGPEEEEAAELEKIAEICSRVPAHAPRDFHEALQYYWFCHLAVITELNGWDAFNPGHLDQHLRSFYQRGLADGTLTPEGARLWSELYEPQMVRFRRAFAAAGPGSGVTEIWIADGTYGSCVTCGEAIAEARLAALPAADRCIVHA